MASDNRSVEEGENVESRTPIGLRMCMCEHC